VADTKISALTAASAGAAANEFAINEAGTSKKLTLAQIDTFVSPTVISSGAAPASGAFPDKGVGSEAWLLNTADNAVTTIEDVMTLTGLVAGTYLFEYFLVWRSGTTTVGCTFTVDYTGTVTRVRATRHGQTALATAADGVADGTVTSLTGGVVQNWGAIADAGALGPNTGVGSTTEDQFEYIRGIIVVSTTADLKLRMNGEGDAAVTFKADSLAIVKRVA
jgi:hypothetical protein